MLLHHLPASLQPDHGWMGVFSSRHVHLISSHRDIAFAELFAVLAAMHIYSPHMKNCTILFRVDNAADVHIINRQSTKNPRLALLLRALFALCLEHNVHLVAVHRAGVDNIIADRLSRPSLHHFHSFCRSSHLSICPLPPPDVVCATLSSASLMHSRQIQLFELEGVPVEHDCFMKLSMLLPA